VIPVTQIGFVRPSQFHQQFEALVVGYRCPRKANKKPRSGQLYTKAWAKANPPD
jgi:hypothetical protein